jgi:hypothetical protein
MPYRRTATALAVAATLAPATAHADPVDPSPPLAVAASGPALAWLRADALVVRDGPGAAPRVVAGRLPRRARQLTLGTDARGRLTAVITGTASNHRAALWRVRLDGKGGVRRVHPNVHGSWEYSPGLRDGVLSFVRRPGGGGIDGVVRTRIMRGALKGGKVRTVHAYGVHYLSSDVQTAVAAGGRVLSVLTDDPQRRGGQSRDRLIAYRGGRRTLVTQLAQTGDGKMDNTGASGLGPIVLDASGRHATVSRWAAPFDADTNALVTAARDLVTVDVRTGAATRAAAPGGFDVALPLPGEGFAVYGASHRSYTSDPAPASDASGLLQILPAG